MRRNAGILLGAPLLLLSLALSAPGVEVVPGCDPRIQSCEPASAGVPDGSAACEARPHEVDVRHTQAAARRLRQELAAKLAQADAAFVPLNGMGHNYRAQEFPTPARPTAPKAD
jgi:hypothetical protein